MVYNQIDFDIHQIKNRETINLFNRRRSLKVRNQLTQNFVSFKAVNSISEDFSSDVSKAEAPTGNFSLESCRIFHKSLEKIFFFPKRTKKKVRRSKINFESEEIYVCYSKNEIINSTFNYFFISPQIFEKHHMI